MLGRRAVSDDEEEEEFVVDDDSDEEDFGSSKRKVQSVWNVLHCVPFNRFILHFVSCFPENCRRSQYCSRAQYWTNQWTRHWAFPKLRAGEHRYL